MGGALRHALLGGLATTLAAASLAALTPEPAAAVSTGRPTEVAVAADGTSYVGFAGSARLLTLAPTGSVTGSVPLDRDDPLTGLDVAPDGRIWVDDGDSVSALTPDGDVLTHFPHRPAVSCAADRAHDPARYGGIEVSDDAVYVAGRCAPTVGIYDLEGDLLATIDPPGSGLPGDVAIAPAHQGLPSRLYVSVPDAGKVFMYNARTLRSDPDPVRTLVPTRQAGFRDPEPGPVIADEKGQLGVVDLANNGLFFYNGTDDYWFYRALGHPPDPGSARGSLDRPTAVDHAAGSFKKGLWIADSGNGRVQQWDHGGTTVWMTDTTPPGDPGAPTSTGPPEITGPPVPGRVLSCSTGSWGGSPTSYAVGWRRDGLAIAGADTDSYTVTAEDVGRALTCVVVATDDAGASSAPTASEELVIPGPGSPPHVVERPIVQGNPRSGAVLRCSRGSWTDPDPPSYRWGWLRDGQLLPGTNAPEYLATESDVTHQLSCRVAAGNANGIGTAAISAPVTVEEGSGTGGVDRPALLRKPQIFGDPSVGAELFCEPGSWESAPTFTYRWRRDGQPIGGAETDRYEVAPDDRDQELTCLVTATNPAGSEQASSAPVLPRGPTDGGGGAATCRGKASVKVNGGARYARRPYVKLKVRAPAGATAIRISNDAGFRKADTRALTSSCTYRWTLPKKSSKQPKTVRVRFVGASAGTVEDRIVLDSFAPRLKRVSATWKPTWWAWVLRFRVVERGTGLARVEVGKSRSGVRKVRWGKPVASADSSQLRWVRVVDKAGNTSRWYRLRI